MTINRGPDSLCAPWTFEYDNLLVEFVPWTGDYNLYENLLGYYLGRLQLHEGPGWILDTRLAGINSLQQYQLQTVVSLLEDLNSDLPKW